MQGINDWISEVIRNGYNPDPGIVFHRCRFQLRAHHRALLTWCRYNKVNINRFEVGYLTELATLIASIAAVWRYQVKQKSGEVSAN